MEAAAPLPEEDDGAASGGALQVDVSAGQNLRPARNPRPARTPPEGLGLEPGREGEGAVVEPHPLNWNLVHYFTVRFPPFPVVGCLSSSRRAPSRMGSSTASSSGGGFLGLTALAQLLSEGYRNPGSRLPIRPSDRNPCGSRLQEAFSWICGAVFALLLWLKLDGRLERGWRVVFQPLAISYGALSVVSFICLAKMLHHYRALQPSSPRTENQELMRRLVLWRNLCECTFKLLQSVGLYALVVLLPAYVEQAEAREIRAPTAGSFALGTNIDAGADPSINTIMLPLWVAWSGEVLLWLLFEHVKSRRFVRRAQSMTSRISNRFLRVHLLSILRKVVLRPNARTFAHNLHLTLVAKMISGAYDFNWATVFIAAWVHYALLGLFLLYLSLLGCFCTVLDCIHHSRRGKAYLKTLLAAFGGIWVFSVSVLSIVSNFLFFLALATRLDGDKSVSTWQLFGPLMAHYIFSAVLGPVRYLVVQRETVADESMLAMVEAQGTEEREAARVMAAWVREREAYRPPGSLLQISAGFYRLKNQVMPAMLGRDSEDDKPESGRTKAGGARDDCPLAVENLDGDGDLEEGGEQGGGGGETAEAAGEAEQTDVATVFGVCQICFEDDSVADSVFLPCGHGGVCRECAERVVNRDPQCHMCRHKVLRVASVAPKGKDGRTGLMEVAVVASTPSPLGASSAARLLLPPNAWAEGP